MKSLKKLIIPLTLLLVIIIALVIVVIVKNNKPEEVKMGEGSYNIVDYYMDDIVSLRIDRSTKNPLVIKSYLNSDGIVEFLVEGTENDGVSYSQQNFAAFLAVMLDYVATNKFDSKDLNLSDYGLVEPEYQVTVNLKNGETKIIKLGSILPSDSTKCYVMVDGDSCIYVVPAAKRSFCEYDALDFYATVDASIDFKEVDSIRFVRKSDGTDITSTVTIYPDTGAPLFDIVEPFETDAGAYLTTLLKTMGGLQIPTFVDLSDEEIQKYGLDDAEYQFTYTMKNGDVFEVSLSKDLNGVYYGRANTLEYEFILSTQMIKYINAPLMDLLNGYVYYFYVTDILKIEGSYAEVNFEYTFDTEDSIISDKATILLDGRNAKIFNSKGRCYASVLFESLACIDIGGVDVESKPALENPVLTLKILDKTYKATNIDFVQRDDASYYVFIDEQYTGFFVYSSELYKDGGTDTYNYGIIPAYELLTEAISNNINGMYEIESED